MVHAAAMPWIADAHLREASQPQPHSHRETLKGWEAVLDACSIGVLCSPSYIVAVDLGAGSRRGVAHPVL